MPSPAPTTQELQQALATVRNRLRAVEAVALRPINISVTINFPDWPNPKAWLKRWLADHNRRLQARHREAGRRQWRRLCRKIGRNPRSATSAELDRAWAVFAGMDGWRPPKPWLVRLRAWWGARAERREVRRMRRLAEVAKRDALLIENGSSRRQQLRRLKTVECGYSGYRWLGDGLHGGLKSIDYARERILEREE